ncbi:hypothetical protein TRVL_04407 [Trypanosoma vivax]|nr:hypothetical protein TRVL_04407 [Trypanosoma vivax]
MFAIVWISDYCSHSHRSIIVPWHLLTVFEYCMICHMRSMAPFPPAKNARAYTTVNRVTPVPRVQVAGKQHSSQAAIREASRNDSGSAGETCLTVSRSDPLPLRHPPYLLSSPLPSLLSLAVKKSAYPRVPLIFISSREHVADSVFARTTHVKQKKGTPACPCPSFILPTAFAQLIWWHLFFITSSLVSQGV